MGSLRSMPVRTVTVRGRSLMKVLLETPLVFIRREVEEMTPEEATEIWSHLEPFFQGVCARASARRRDEAWALLVRKMDLIRRRAEEAEV